MLDLIADMLASPEAQVDPYIWAAAFTGHMAVGLGLTAAVAWPLSGFARDWVDGVGWLALMLVVVAYALVWEALLQRLGAGVMDAAVDTAAVFLGGLIGVAAWERRGPVIGAALIAALAFLARGVRR
jgi:hypothetical protein